MNPRRWAGPALLVLGVGLVLAAVATGAAQVELLVILPVFVGGASALFLGGVLAIFLGLVLLPLSLGMEFALDPIGAEPTESSAPPRSGGVVLVGPFPLFFGSWRSPSRASWWVAAGVGAAMVVALLLLAAAIR